jgi:hypothetical protein
MLTAPTQAGQLRVTATADGVSAGVSVIVAPGPVASVEIWPSLLNITLDGSAGLTAAAYDEYGNAVPDATFSWTTTIGSIDAATDTSHATFEAGTEDGNGTITATSGGESATMVVNVLVSEEGGTTGTSAITWAALVIAIIAIVIAVLMFLLGRKSKAAESPPPAEPPEVPQTPS